MEVTKLFFKQYFEQKPFRCVLIRFQNMFLFINLYKRTGYISNIQSIFMPITSTAKIKTRFKYLHPIKHIELWE